MKFSPISSLGKMSLLDASRNFLLAGVLAGSSLFSSSLMAETLSEVINKALAEHPQAQAGLNRYRAATESIDVAWGAWWPSIDITTGIGGQKKSYPDDQPNEALGDKSFTRKEASFSVRQNLFSGFNTSSSVAQSRHSAAAEYLRLRNTLQDLALRIADVYLKVLERRDLVELAEENLEVHNSILKQIAQRARQGVARSSDLDQIQGRVARATANVINARNNLMDAESEYHSLVGSMPGDLEQPGSYKLNIQESFDQALQASVSRHPGILATEQEIKASESQESATDSSYFPTLDIEVDKSWRNNADGQLGTHEDTTAMLRLRYNLFRGGSDRARSKESAYRTEESRAQRDRMLRNVEETLRLAWSAYEFIGEQKQYLRQHEESSKKTVKAYREQFNIGKRTLLDLLDSENELFQSSRSLTTAVYQEAFARYRIIAATGELLEKLEIILPADWQEQE
ncbi:TolC family outer membrane protein [Endozoicomonas arenosclerae]|uniref:TolC family outer membrane protein n=1 Tax=Endozoicomonas arenosclerae TaxID=1633495 RepID=UPI000AB5C23A|nr:TolC family outer membrane protein [Endozoicomonas arenosclerae]